MALETLKDIKVIDGFPLMDANEVPEESQGHHEFKEYLTTHPVVVDHDWNLIMFKLQDGAIQEAGVNGCQVETLIHTALLMLKGLNARIPCLENNNAINRLEMALHWLGERTKNRQQRGVAGTHNA